MLSGMSDVTHILSAIECGDEQASERLWPLVYEELRSLAAKKMAQERPGQTLQATALVHEAYKRLVDIPHAQRWDNRWHFFAAAAEAMRRILVECARRSATVKHGGKFRRVELDEQLAVNDQRGCQLLALDEALGNLEKRDAQAAELVKLRYFAGLSHQEAAEALRISRRAADRLWALAKAWLYQQLAAD
jgi:RNA polymerase sigma factor (TIGR02999 family)